MSRKGNAPGPDGVPGRLFMRKQAKAGRLRTEIMRKQAKAGTTLVEMVVAMLLTSILLTAMVGILSPAAKLFVRMQRLQFAQVVMDNTVQELRSMLEDAAGYLKIYDICEIDTQLEEKDGAESGLALEFLNTQGYVTLISTGGCPDTDIYMGTLQIDTIQAADVEPGRLLARYYAFRTGDNYYYKDKSGRAVARAVQKVFADGYYMGNFLEIEFSYPPGLNEGDEVGYLEAQVKLFGDEGKQELLVQDHVTLDLRYQAVKKTTVTARQEP